MFTEKQNVRSYCVKDLTNLGKDGSGVGSVGFRVSLAWKIF